MSHRQMTKPVVRQTSCCPEFEYETHPRRGQLKSRIASVLVSLRRGQVNIVNSCQDTRSFHRYFFSDFTPPALEYYAGHYRGEDFICLRSYNVAISGDPRVGAPAPAVAEEMSRAAEIIRSGLAALDTARLLPSTQIEPHIKLLYSVIFACRVFELVLRIHPYANGNGHMARLLIWMILGQYGYWPKRWPIEPRPPAPYTDLIIRYRNGDVEPLEKYVISCIIGH